MVQRVRSKPTSKFNAQDLIAFGYDVCSLIDSPNLFEDNPPNVEPNRFKSIN
jgi:hypothetical protein